jgi:hypothetical protein
VNAVVLKVVHVIANEPSEMLFVQRVDMVENLSAAAFHPALRNPVLPGCLNTRALRAEARRLQERNHIAIEFRVVVEDGITIRTSQYTATNVSSLGAAGVQFRLDLLGSSGFALNKVEARSSCVLFEFGKASSRRSGVTKRELRLAEGKTGVEFDR